MRAFVFPGQGSQYPGMGSQLARVYPEARETFQEADDALNVSLSTLCFEGPKEVLVLTQNTQPALLTVSIAVFRVLQSKGVIPDFVAGHSLGEYSALVAAGSLEFTQALRLVRRRGELMQRAVPVGVGAMAAIVGLDLEAIIQVCREATGTGIVVPANHNSPVQIAVAGHKEAVEKASKLALERGARRAVELPVSAPFHCELMRPAEDGMRPLLSAAPFRDLGIPLVNNVDAAVVRDGEQARDGLIRQITAMVRWTESVQLMAASGVLEFVEVGAGKVLSGLVRRIARGVTTASIETPEQVEAYV